MREIAAELGCSFYTVRKYWRRRRKQSTPPKRGRPSTGILSAYPAEWVEQALATKKAHPHWGATTVQVKLAARLGRSVSEMPSRARLAALFKERCPEAVQSRQQRAYSEKRPLAVRYPHQRWQLDAQEGIAAVKGEKVNLLNIHDPIGIMIGSQAFLTTSTLSAPNMPGKPSRHNSSQSRSFSAFARHKASSFVTCPLAA